LDSRRAVRTSWWGLTSPTSKKMKRLTKPTSQSLALALQFCLLEQLQ
jgi:hypothetical protein